MGKWELERFPAFPPFRPPAFMSSLKGFAKTFATEATGEGGK